jgi:hypothetical protein
MRKEVVVDNFEVLPRYFRGAIEKDHEASVRAPEYDATVLRYCATGLEMFWYQNLKDRDH